MSLFVSFVCFDWLQQFSSLFFFFYERRCLLKLHPSNAPTRLSTKSPCTTLNFFFFFATPPVVCSVPSVLLFFFSSCCWAASTYTYTFDSLIPSIHYHYCRYLLFSSFALLVDTWLPLLNSRSLIISSTILFGQTPSHTQEKKSITSFGADIKTLWILFQFFFFLRSSAAAHVSPTRCSPACFWATCRDA